MTIEIKPFFHLKSNTFCYVVFDKSSNKGAVIDSCLDFDVTTGKTNSEHADLVISYIKENNISIEWSSSSLKEFLYVPNKHYLIYFEDDLLLKTKKIYFNYN